MRKADSRVNMARALERSLAMLGEPSKKALLFHLTHTLKIPMDKKNCSLEEIEGALKKIFGEEASSRWLR
jgi:hypothetical protein